MWMTPLPALGVPTPICITCFEQQVWSQYWQVGKGRRCQKCNPLPPPEVLETPLRAYLCTIDPPSAEDITAYHLEGMKTRTPEQEQWLAAFKEQEQERRKKQAEAEANLYGTHIGKIGERVYLNVLVDMVKQLPDNQFGERWLVIMTDTETSGKIKWFTGANCRLKQGQSYMAKMTVKDHAVWNGGRETVVNRVSEDRDD